MTASSGPPRTLPPASSGIAGLDPALGGGFLWGDNVIWRCTDAEVLARIYGAIGPPSRDAGYALLTVEGGRLAQGGGRTDGPDALLSDLERTVPERSPAVVLFEPFAAMAQRWGTAEAAGFYERCCPALLDMGAVAYWAMGPGEEPFATLTDEMAQCIVEIDGDVLRITKAEGRQPARAGTVLRLAEAAGEIVAEPPAAAQLVAEALTRLRREHGLAQSELARLAGVSQSAVSQAERGQHSLSLDTVLRLAANLGTSLDELLGVRRDGRPTHLLGRHRLGSGPGARVIVDAPQLPSRVVVVEVAPHGTTRLGRAQAVLPATVCVASGLVEARLASTAAVLRPGEAAVVPDGRVESLRNLSDEPAVAFVVYGAPGSDASAQPQS